MRPWTILISTLALSLAGAARAAGPIPLAPPLAPQQIALCRLHYKRGADENNYAKARASMNSIQQVSAPPPPQLLDYSVQFAKDSKASDEIKDWTGRISFQPNARTRTVELMIQFQCPPETNPYNAGQRFPRAGDFGDVRNEGIQTRTGWETYLASNGYTGIPLDGPMAAGLAQIPNDGMAHYVRFSGNLIYLPSVAGPRATPTYARPDTSPSAFNVNDMMLLFRITSLTVFR